MADRLIMDEIYTTLEKGQVTVSTHGEFRHRAGVHGSAREVKRALGSMIKAGVVRRCRPDPEGVSAGPSPITFKLWHHGTP